MTTTATRREIPMLFQGWGIKAIKELRKTVTRRTIALPSWANDDGIEVRANEAFAIDTKTGDERQITCPYGEPGDLLLPVCTWAAAKDHDELRPRQLGSRAKIWTQWDGGKPRWAGKLRPGRFMTRQIRKRVLPRLEVNSICIEALQMITSQDVFKEGIRIPVSQERNLCVALTGDYLAADYVPKDFFYPGKPKWTSRDWDTWYIANFAAEWDRINAKRKGGIYSWRADPLVWRVEFSLAD